MRIARGSEARAASPLEHEHSLELLDALDQLMLAIVHFGFLMFFCTASVGSRIRGHRRASILAQDGSSP